MLSLTDIRPEMLLEGVVPGVAVKVMASSPIGFNGIHVFKGLDEGQKEKMLFKTGEANLKDAGKGRSWTLNGDAEKLRLAAGAYRIHLAHLFDHFMVINHFQCGSPAPSGERRVRIHAAQATPTICSGRRSRIGQNHHGRSPNSRTDQMIEETASDYPFIRNSF